MILQLAGVLDPVRAEAARAVLEETAFADGSKTAGWHAKAVKANEQAEGPAVQKLLAEVEKTLLAHPVFKAAAQPKPITKAVKPVIQAFIEQRPADRKRILSSILGLETWETYRKTTADRRKLVLSFATKTFSFNCSRRSISVSITVSFDNGIE